MNSMKEIKYWRRKSDDIQGKVTNSYTYRKKMLMLLSEYITFDAYCCTAVDPLTLNSIGAVSEHSLENIFQQLLLAEYEEAEINTFDQLISSGAYIGRLSDSFGVHPSKRYESVLKPHQFSDELRCALIYQGQCFGFLILLKKQYRPDPLFSDADIERIKVIAPIIAQALQAYYHAIIDVNHTNLEQGILILNSDLNVISSNTQAEKMLHDLRALETIEEPYLPKPLQVLCSKLLVSGKSSTPLLIPVPSYGYISIEVSALESLSTINSQLTVLFRQASPTDMLYYLVKAYHLTVREQAVVWEVIKGSSTKEIAQHLAMSYHTAQDHLKSIFVKVNVSNRNELVWKLFSKYQL